MVWVVWLECDAMLDRLACCVICCCRRHHFCLYYICLGISLPPLSARLVDPTYSRILCSFLPFPIMWQVKAMTEKTTKEVEQILHSAEHKA